MLKADHNVVAAHEMAVDSEWLATGKGKARSERVWPLSAELLAALHAADAHSVRRAENAARNVLNLDPLPRDPAPPRAADAAVSSADQALAPEVLASLATVTPERSTGKGVGQGRAAPSAPGARRRTV